MADLKKWIREYELVFSGPNQRIVISSVGQKNPLDIKFNVTYNPDFQGQGTLSLSVFGLKESTVSEIIQPGVKVWLSVGYKGQDLTTLFTGGVRKAWVEDSSSKHETKIKAMTSRLGSKPMPLALSGLETNYSRLKILIASLRNSVPELNIDRAFKDLEDLRDSEPTRSELKERNLEDRTLLTDQAIGALTLNDTGLASLQKVLDTFNIQALTVNDSLYLIRKGGKIKNVNVIQAKLGDNLLKPPRKRLDNMEVAPDSPNAVELFELTMLLEPTLFPNRVVAASHRRTDTGELEEKALVIKATEVTHSGQYRGSEYTTTVAGTVDGSYLVRSPIKSVAYDVDNTYLEPNFFSPGSKFIGSGFSGIV